MKKTFHRLLSLLLLLVLMFQTLAVSAAEGPVLEISQEVSADNVMSAEPGESENMYQQKEMMADDIMGEMEEWREADTKHFRMSDGSFIAVKYDTNVHYQNAQEEWVDIDNSLKKVTETVTLPAEIPAAGTDSRRHGAEAEQPQTVEVEQLQPKDGVETVQFSAKSAVSEVADFAMVHDKYEIGVSMIDAQEKPAEIVEPEPIKDKKSLAAGVNLPNLTSVVRYKDVQDGIDLEYILHGEDIKENIIVKKRMASYAFSFDLDLQNLKPIANEDGSISLVSKETQEEIYLIPAPYMEDSNKVTSGDVRYKMVPAEEFYKEHKPDAVASKPEGSDSSPTQESPLPEESSDDLISVPAEEQSNSSDTPSSSIHSQSKERTGLSESSLEVPEESRVPSETHEPPVSSENPESSSEASQNTSETDSKQSVKQYGENDYVFTVTADEQWMNEKDRAYPVTIDPPIIVQYGKTQDRQMSTTYVMSGRADWKPGDFGDMYLGYSGGDTLHNRIYARINELPTLPSDTIIVHAGLYLAQTHNSYSQVGMSTMNVPVYELTSGPAGSTDEKYKTSGDWIKTDVSWNTKPANDKKVLDYAKISAATNGTYVGWNITGVTKKWYHEKKYFGLAFIPYEESKFAYNYGARAIFEGYNGNSATKAKPKFIIQYRNTAGLEDYYTYESQSIDRAGTGYVNDQTGQLVVVKPILSQASGNNPFTLNTVYNSTFSTGQFTTTNSESHPMQLTKDFTKMMMGKGWKLSVQETIVEKVMKDPEEKDITYFVHNDADGTYHYYAKDPAKNDGYYYDEDGLKLKISKSGTTYTMYDEKNNKKVFYNGILGMMEDRNGNKIRMIYNNSSALSSGTAWQPKGTGDRLLQIRQQNSGATEITLATLSYNSSNMLQSITDGAGRVTQFTFLYGWLKEILHSDGTKALYNYAGPDERMDAARDNESQRKITYGYYANEVNGIKEYGNEVAGKMLWRRTGAHDYTVYRNPGADRSNNTADDTLSYVLFDYMGRTVNHYTTDNTDRHILGASNAKFTVNSGISKQNNQVTQNASIGVAAVNLLQNVGLEGSGGWTTSGSGLSINSSKPRTGTKAMAAVNSSDSWYYQSVSVEPGKAYTFSAYVNTADAGISSDGGVRVKYEDGNSVGLGELLNIKTASDVGKGWQRIDANFVAKSGTVQVGVQFKGITGAAYADDLQLEEGNAPSNANLVENGGFERSGSWTLMNEAPGKTEYTTVDRLGGGKSMRIDGAPTVWGLAYQDIPVNLPGTETYILSGWAKANSVPTKTDAVPAFTLYAEIYYEGGGQENHTVDMQPDIQAGAYSNWELNGWQYGSVAVVPKQSTKTVSKIRVHANYKFNANTAYFDNMSLVREYAQTYKYDKDGKLVSVGQSGKDEVNYTYSGANLIQAASKSSGKVDYTYDVYNNVKTVKNDKVTMMLTNNSGNVTKSTLSSTGSSRTLSSSAAYSADKNRMTSVTDANAISMSLAYDSKIPEINGTPSREINSIRTVNHSYNPLNGRLAMSYQSGVASIETAYTGGQPSETKRGGYIPGVTGKQIQSYQTQYDEYGKITGIGIKGSDGTIKPLASYTYAPNNGNPLKMKYGNDLYAGSIDYAYDNLDRLKETTYNDGTVYTYTYTGDGMLNNITDSSSGIRYGFNYDSLGRQVGFSEKDSSGRTLQYGFQKYDGSNRLSGSSYFVPGITPEQGRKEEYTYNDTNGTMTKMVTAAGDTMTLSYDGFNRMTDRSVSNTRTRYGYYFDDSTKTDSMQVAWKQYTIGSQAASGFSYEYDAIGRLKSETDKLSGFYSSYTYDTQNQLTSEWIGNGYATLEGNYVYDTYGNIREKTVRGLNGKTVKDTYTYGDAVWLDLLTAVNGKPITYDAIGNPTKYHDGTVFTWEKGRRLASSSNSAAKRQVEYRYDTEGKRTGKTVTQNGTTIQSQYYMGGGKILAEKRGNDVLEFIYDEKGAPLNLIYNGVKYSYITNLMGDVIHLVTESGSVAAEYVYDAWGKVILTKGSMSEINPLRYRGYYFDTETGLYYLNSRYYDPMIGRFINADGTTNTNNGFLGLNMYAYCLNNPVQLKDENGSRPAAISDDPRDQAAANAEWGLTRPGVGNNIYYQANKQKEHNANRRPNTGIPNSSWKAPNGDWRTFDSKGRPKLDYDHNDHSDPNGHPHDAKGGHYHDWDWTRSRGKERGDPYIPEAPDAFDWTPLAGVGLILLAGLGTVWVVANNATIIGFLDDSLLVPLTALFTKGTEMAFG